MYIYLCIYQTVDGRRSQGVESKHLGIGERCFQFYGQILHLSLGGTRLSSSIIACSFPSIHLYTDKTRPRPRPRPRPRQARLVGDHKNYRAIFCPLNFVSLYFVWCINHNHTRRSDSRSRSVSCLVIESCVAWLVDRQTWTCIVL
jgi:hypothetical protein